MTTTSSPSRLRTSVTAMLTAAALFTTTTFSARASIQDEMNRLYTGIASIPSSVASELQNGVLTQGPSAIHGQAYHTYVGGRVYKHMPVRDLTFANVEMPHFSAGCGGVDIYLGSFSHLNADELVQFLKATAMNAVGVVTQLALKSITPQLSAVLDTAKNIADRINGMHLNSCETAQAMVAGGMNAMTANKHNQCVQQRMVYGNMDINEAKAACQTNTDVDAGLAAGGPTARKPVFTGNLTWEALKRTMDPADSESSRDEREMIMSLVGSQIYYRDRAGGGTAGGSALSAVNNNEKVSLAKEPLRLHPTITSISMLLTGANGAPDPSNPGKILVPMYRCLTPGGAYDPECLTPRTENVSIDSLSAKVQQQLQGIADRLVNREALTNDDLGIINSTTLPIYEMLTAATEVPGSAMASMLIENYKEVIAADHAFVLVARNVTAGQKALSADFSLDETQTKDRDFIYHNATMTMRSLNEQKNEAQKKLADMSQFGDFLQQYQRALSSNVPGRVMLMASRNSGAGTAGRK